MTEPPVEQTPAVLAYWREKEGMYVHTRGMADIIMCTKRKDSGLFVWHTVCIYIVKERES